MFVLVILLIPGIHIGMNTMEIVFIIQEPEHSCKISNLGLNATATIGSMSTRERLKLISPSVKGPDGTMTRDGCMIYDVNFTNVILQADTNWTAIFTIGGENASFPLKMCNAWDYDETDTGRTVVSEWDLVCDRTWLKGLIKSVQLIGQLFGVIIGGTFSDRFGRKTVGRVSIILTIVMRLIMAFNPVLEVYMVARMVNGACDLLLYSSYYIICSEVLSPSKRALPASSLGTGYVIGSLFVTLVAWLLPNWKYITLANTVITSLLCLSLFFLPESPRWQYCVGKRNEAKKTLEWMAGINGIKIPSDISFFVNDQDEASEDSGCCKFAKSVLVILRLAANCYIWFSVSMIYYGLSLNVGSLAGNIYVNTIISSLTDIPGCCLVFLIVDSRLGRRFSIFISLFICTACLLTDIAFPRTSIGRIVLSMFGKLFVGIAFNAMYIWTSEMFPTGMRASALGIASAIARVGSSLSPFITLCPGVIPAVIFGLIATMATITVLGLPKTKGKPFPTTVDDMRKQKSLICPCLERNPVTNVYAS